jgi:large subunit ribosomal protein L23
MAKKSITKNDDVSAVSVNSSVIINPRVTEKAAYSAEKNTYVFNVAMSANKIQIKQAIKSMYNVSPTDVNVVVSKPKPKTFRGQSGTQQAFKKAYVTLKKGDTIEIA